MIVQSIAAPLAMLLVWLADPASLLAGGAMRWTLDLLFWGLTLLTILSSMPYALGVLRHMADARSAREIKP